MASKSSITVTFSNSKILTNPLVAELFVSDLIKAVKSGIKDAAKKEAKRTARKIKLAFRNQTFNHPPLKSSYFLEKARQNLDPRVGIATETMVRSLKFVEKSEDEFFIGIPRKLNNKRNRTGSSDVVKYARWFEFGTRKQPARPFLRPSLRVYSRDLPETAKRSVLKNLKDLKKQWETL